MNGEVRLQDGTDVSNGRVEICQNGIWGSVCSKGWDSFDASVVCRQLGYDIEGTMYISICIYILVGVISFVLSSKMWRLLEYLDLEDLCY